MHLCHYQFVGAELVWFSYPLLLLICWFITGFSAAGVGGAGVSAIGAIRSAVGLNFGVRRTSGIWTFVSWLRRHMVEEVMFMLLVVKIFICTGFVVGRHVSYDIFSLQV